MKIILALTGAASILMPLALPAQADVASRIHAIENGLHPAVRVVGMPDTGMAILERMKRFKVPGVSIAVINNMRVEWARGYGVMQTGTGRPVDSTTTFLAGSISKPVAATAALRLVEQGTLSLDSDVNSTLTSWKVPPNEFTSSEHVTLRRLLSHSAGMTVHGFPGYANGAPVPTVVQILNGEAPANTAPVRVDAVPGSRWRYSGGGITVAQLMMTDATGKTFPRLMQELVLVPLGMTRSTYENPLPPGRTLSASSGHENGDLPVSGRWHVYPEMAAAGLWTTPSDLSRWAIEISKASRGESSRVLSQTTAKAMLTEEKGGWGLGVGLRGSGDTFAFQHGGRDEGFVAQLLMFPTRGQGIIVMTNGTSDELIQEIVNAAATEMGWPVRNRAEVTATPVDTLTFRDVTGRYRMIFGTDTVVTQVKSIGGTLHIAPNGYVPLPVVSTGGDAHLFVSPDDGTRFIFSRATGGGPAPELRITSSGGGSVVARRIP